jgi:outer membrane protein
MAERLSRSLHWSNRNSTLELADTVKVRLVEFNKDKGYQIIYSNTGADNILFADEKYDITKEVTEFLNKKYGPATSVNNPDSSNKK